MFGQRCRVHGLASLKKNLYFNAKYGFPGWVSPVMFEEYVSLYQRAKIGFNVHNRGDYTVGSYRLFDLPGNGVMQISDGGKYLDAFFEVGEEIVRYADADEVIGKLQYYLENDGKRKEIALCVYRRTMRDDRFASIMREAGKLVDEGMRQLVERA